MDAKQKNLEWKSHLKEAIRVYEGAEKTCKVTAKAKVKLTRRSISNEKQSYILKSKIFKAWLYISTS